MGDYSSRRNVISSGQDSQRDAGPEKSEIRSGDMPPDMRKEALRLAKDCARRFRIEKDIANEIKVEFDKKYRPHWQCVVGLSFGSKFAHDEGCYIYMVIPWEKGKKLHILLWKIEQLR